MGKGAQKNDPRLTQPCCDDLTPVTTEFETPWFSIRRRGDFFSYEARQPQVTILPIVERDHIVMIRCKRPLVADSPLELPAGGFKGAETPQHAARRELFEETGIYVDDLSRFQINMPFAVISGRSPFLDHAMDIHLSRQEFQNRSMHDTEVDEVVLLALKEAVDHIRTGVIYSIVPMALIQREYIRQLGC